VLGRDEGWHAEHCFILGLQPPGGRRKRYVVGAFPSACGKTNAAMLSLPPAYVAAGWSATTVGDDIAWLRWGADGVLRAVNPEHGVFGVAPGTSAASNGAALAAARAPAGAIYTNVALTPGARDVWWEGLTRAPPPRLTSWLRREWLPFGTPGAEGGEAAHANSRFTAPLASVPCVDAAWDDPAGVPVDAILLGGRRAGVAPLVTEHPTWSAGVLAGATLHSETTAAAEGARGSLRWDPFSMRPFVGYDVGSYFSHWLSPAADPSKRLPAFYSVNWFRRDADGRFVWPGFGENARVLEWVVARAEARDGEGPPPPTLETALGYAPDVAAGGLNLAGSGVPPAAAASLLAVDPAEWRDELARGAAALASVGPRLPRELLAAHAALAARVDAARDGRALPPFPGRAPGRAAAAPRA